MVMAHACFVLDPAGGLGAIQVGAVWNAAMVPNCDTQLLAGPRRA